MSVYKGPQAAPAKAPASGGSKQFLMILISVLLVAVAGAVIYKVLRGDTDAAEARAVAVSTPQGVSKLYESNEHMPPQAKAAAAAAAAAHGAPIGPTTTPGRR